MQRREFLSTGVVAGTVGLFDPATGQAQQITLHDFLRFRFCWGQPHLRRDAHGLIAQNPAHPTLTAYATAITHMKTLPVANPTSWTYQAAIHGTNLSPAQWPAGAPFSTCLHNQHFLAWHRMYLYFFEKIIAKQSGMPGFALPYWNYGKVGQRDIPAAFRQTSGALAVLRDNSRSTSLNNGNPISAGTASAATALAQGSFLGFQSQLNGQPHGVVHTTVGGNMGGFNTAGLDPLFWLHHCNIDRLWEAWLAQGTGQVNLIADPAWMSHTSTFADENGGLVSMANADVLETASQLHYQYEEPRDCIPLLVLNVDLRRILEKFRPIFQLVLARQVKLPISARFVPLGDREAMRKVEPYLERRPKERGRLQIVVEGLKLNKPMQGYFEIRGRLALAEKELRSKQTIPLGTLSTFGMDAASMDSMRAGGQSEEDMAEAMAQRIDVTDAVRKLFGDFDAETARLELEIRAVSGVEGDRETIEALNEGLEVTAEEIRYEVVVEEG